MIRLLLLARQRATLALIGVVAVIAACVYVPREPDPSAIAAANQIAAEITAHRTAADLGVRLSTPALETFARVYDRVKTDYVRPTDDETLLTAARKGMHEAYPDPKGVEDDKLVMAAISAMLTSLDRYSTYLDPSDWRAMREQTRGEFGGLGVEVRKSDDGVLVIAPIDGTPAHRAGLKTGDVITHADGKALGPMDLRDAVKLLRGRPGSAVTLTIARKDSDPFDVEILREVIRVSGVKSRTEGDIGYLRISAFTRGIAQRVTAEWNHLKTRHGKPLRGLIIDFRNNPGGLFDESLQIADAFLHQGRIVSTEGRHDRIHHDAEPGDITGGLPLVVLINGGSASASEIVAGALRDQHRATLIGTKSFGKGTVQTLIPLGQSDALRLTTAIYLTPSGQSVDGGIEPNIKVEADDAREGDEQLDRALEILRGATTPRS